MAVLEDARSLAPAAMARPPADDARAGEPEAEMLPRRHGQAAAIEPRRPRSASNIFIPASNSMDVPRYRVS